MLEIFPQLSDVKIDYAWGGTLGITRQRMPYFCRLTDTILSVSGYSGHGLGTWEDAINYFGNDNGIKQIFSKQLIDNLIRTKRQELSEFKKIESSEHWKYYVSAI